MLPQGLTLFLAEGMAEESDDTPSSLPPMSMDSPWVSPSEGPQYHPVYTGGHQLKVPTKPSTAQSRSQSRPKGGLDPVNHPLLMDPGGDEQDQRPSPLVEGKSELVGGSP